VNKINKVNLIIIRKFPKSFADRAKHPETSGVSKVWRPCMLAKHPRYCVRYGCCVDVAVQLMAVWGAK